MSEEEILKWVAIFKERGFEIGIGEPGSFEHKWSERIICEYLIEIAKEAVKAGKC